MYHVKTFLLPITLHQYVSYILCSTRLHTNRQISKELQMWKELHLRKVEGKESMCQKVEAGYAKVLQEKGCRLGAEQSHQDLLQKILWSSML